MSELRYQAGLSNAGSYTISGIPWASSSLPAPSTSSAPTQVSFPFVTKFIVVKNVSATGGASMRVGFSENGISGSNYFLLAPGESFAADIRVKDLYLLSNNGSAATGSIIAGLTGINISNLATNWSGSAGVG
jgi:hypothetical protein